MSGKKAVNGVSVVDGDEYLYDGSDGVDRIQVTHTRMRENRAAAQEPIQTRQEPGNPVGEQA
jgi:hypothetical protein